MGYSFITAWIDGEMEHHQWLFKGLRIGCGCGATVELAWNSTQTCACGMVYSHKAPNIVEARRDVPGSYSIQQGDAEWAEVER